MIRRVLLFPEISSRLLIHTVPLCSGRSPCGGYHSALERGTIAAMTITTIDRGAAGDAKMDYNVDHGVRQQHIVTCGAAVL